MLHRNRLEGQIELILTGASPDFTRDEFLAHVQARVNEALNSYADNATQKAALGIEKLTIYTSKWCYNRYHL